MRTANQVREFIWVSFSGNFKSCFCCLDLFSHVPLEAVVCFCKEIGIVDPSWRSQIQDLNLLIYATELQGGVLHARDLIPALRVVLVYFFLLLSVAQYCVIFDGIQRVSLWSYCRVKLMSWAHDMQVFVLISSYIGIDYSVRLGECLVPSTP